MPWLVVVQRRECDARRTVAGAHASGGAGHLGPPRPRPTGPRRARPARPTSARSARRGCRRRGARCASLSCTLRSRLHDPAPLARRHRMRPVPHAGIALQGRLTLRAGPGEHEVGRGGPRERSAPAPLAGQGDRSARRSRRARWRRGCPRAGARRGRDGRCGRAPGSGASSGSPRPARASTTGPELRDRSSRTGCACWSSSSTETCSRTHPRCRPSTCPR